MTPAALAEASLAGKVGPEDFSRLCATSTEVLNQAASLVRDATYGRVVTYSPKAFFPLTMACRDRCGYCTFAKPPSRLQDIYMSPEQLSGLAGTASKAGCQEALLTLGEAPEERYPAARRWLEDHGYSSTVEYLVQACKLISRESGLLCHSNAGALSEDDLATLRDVTVSQGAMIESLRPDLPCHTASPDKDPSRRLATLQAAGRLQIPFTTGILVGIGENEQDRCHALWAIAESHRLYGQVQEVIVQNFLPKAGTAMWRNPPAGLDEHLRAVSIARLLLPREIHVQAPPNLVADPARLLAAGIDDWGGVSPLTLDHVNPERPWPELERLANLSNAAGHILVPRLPVHPSHLSDLARWEAPGMARLVLASSDASGLAREDPWVAGGGADPPVLVRSSSPAPPLDPLVGRTISELAEGKEPEEADIIALFGARGPDVAAVAAYADSLRRQRVGDEITWVANRNINYTNVCTFGCSFCAFSRGPRSLGNREAPYLMSLSDVADKVAAAVEAGATEVCLQGGIHPSFDGQHYLSVIKAVREVSRDIHIHGFTALEVWEGARRLGEGLPSYLQRLADAGLRSLPGTAAEILDDEVRAVLCPDKIDTDTWLEVHRQAHRIGLKSNVTIMFGAVENPRHWARHILATRDLQKETGGFTEFVPLPFVHMGAPIFLKGRSRRGPTFREVVLMHAVGRIAYDKYIPNIQASWVKTGVKGVRQLLLSGCNDLGGTLMDENISRAAGASHGRAMDAAAFASLVEPLGRTLSQRTTLYGRIAPLAA